MSGWTNPVLDKIGAYRWAEKVVLKLTGVEPRCWYELEEEWLELELELENNAGGPAEGK